MLDSIDHMTLKELKIAFWYKKVKIVSSITQRYNTMYNVIT